MKIKILMTFGLLFFCFGQECLCAVEKSDKLKPVWLRTVPRPGNSSYYFKVVYTDAGTHLSEARVLARKELAMSIERSEHIKIDETLDYRSQESVTTGEENAEIGYTFKVRAEGKSQNLHYERVDEYWESSLENGKRVVRLYTLFAVGSQAGRVQIDHFKRETRYGARGLVRSVIPGWGQMYKGSMVKGGCILGGEILLAGGIIIAENLRASYIKKRNENPRQMKTYNTKADNWENIRNVCIGGAVALYVYNLVDAIVAPGAPRLVREKQKSLSLIPVWTPQYNGMSLVFKF